MTRRVVTRASGRVGVPRPARPSPVAPTSPFPVPACRPIPHLAARSALAGGPALIEASEFPGTPPAPPRRLRVRRRLALFVVVGVVVGAAAAAFVTEVAPDTTAYPSWLTLP